MILSTQRNHNDAIGFCIFFSSSLEKLEHVAIYYVSSAMLPLKMMMYTQLDVSVHPMVFFVVKYYWRYSDFFWRAVLMLIRLVAYMYLRNTVLFSLLSLKSLQVRRIQSLVDILDGLKATPSVITGRPSL